MKNNFNMKKAFLELSIISVILIIFLFIFTLYSWGSEIWYVGIFLLVGIYVFWISLTMLFFKKIYIDWYMSCKSNLYFTSIMISFISIVLFFLISGFELLVKMWNFLWDRWMIFSWMIMWFLTIVLYWVYLERKNNVSINIVYFLLMITLSVCIWVISYFIQNIFIGYLVIVLLYVLALWFFKHLKI